MLNEEKRTEITIEYRERPNFKVIQVDGAQGGVGPNDDIQVAFYQERWPIPQSVVHEVISGHLGAEIKDRRKISDSAIRDVEIELSMSPDTAIKIGSWLVEKGGLAKGWK